MPNLNPITLTRLFDDIEVGGKKIHIWAQGGLTLPEVNYAWELMPWLKNNLGPLITLRLKELGVLKSFILANDVVAHESAVFDPEKGPIIVDEKAVIEPFAYIKGPAYIGPHCVIKSHASIGPNVSLGAHCKVGGEVANSLFQAYSNKAHYGYVGDSYVGSWVNMGAGTTTSNLKSTYGTIRVNAQGEIIDTRLQFLGAIIGDYAKLAINTLVMAGKTIGVNSYVSGVIDENIPSFALIKPETIDRVEIESAITTQKRMFARRGVEQTEEDIQLLRDIFEGEE
jgi:UDP-N-acetylglucosamine diphosphorylase / glucose-1-phosphate thymidylyltransferase / UDP-N-acetylgalactosamine diphosphorylase / glucosamine-1-phosphate N-acetyltransferase / galactosamine-1-phosphate N-acetyltransferase